MAASSTPSRRSFVPSPSSPASVPRLLLWLILAGLLARVIYLGQVAALPFFHEPVGDSARYLDRAREILAGRLAGDRPFFYGGILYPWLLAADLLLFGSNLYPVCLLQTAAGCAMAFVLYRLAREASPGGPAAPWIGLTAAGLAVLYGPFAFLEADILMISWTLLLLMTGGMLMLAAAGRCDGEAARWWRLAAAGVCLALAATERPNLLSLLPAACAWAAWFVPRGRRMAAALCLAGGAACVLSLVAAMNHAASGRWVLLTTSSGINFYIGNHEGARGTYDEPWSAADPEFAASHVDLEEASLTMARRESGRPLDAVEASSFWLDRGLSFITGHPGEAAALTLRKLALFWSAAEIPNHLDFSFMRTVAPALWLMPIGFVLVAPLGLYGLIHPAPRRLLGRPAASLLALFVLAPMLTVLPFFVADRYRVVVVPPLMVAAGAAVVSLWRDLGLRLVRRRACLHLACLVLAGLAMTRPIVESDVSRNHWMMAQAYRRQGRIEEALASYRLAVEAAPEDALVRNSLGVALEQGKDFEGAREAYRRAVELDPRLTLPHRNLGLILMRGLPATAGEAAAHLSIAEKAAPEDVDVARALAALMLARGETAAARARAETVLRALPGDRTARQVLEATGSAPPP